MPSHLCGKVNLSILRELYRKELLELLDSCTGSKCILWDDRLTGPISLITDYKVLKEHDVDKMHAITANLTLPQDIVNIIFILRPTVDLISIVADIVRSYSKQSNDKKQFFIYFVPRKSLLGEKKLKDLGVYGCFTNITEFRLDLIPFDNDLLSMNYIDTFKESRLENDHTSLFYVAQSLMTLQSLYGTFPSLTGKGEMSKKVINMMVQMKRSLNPSTNQIPPQIDRLLIMDRNIDLITPFLSPLTYEALIDDIYEINNTIVKLPGEKFSQEENAGEDAPPKKLNLNSSDELYAELRDKHVNAVGGHLSRSAKSIHAQFDERHAVKNIKEIKKFVTKIPQMNILRTSTANHTSIAELLKEVTSSDAFIDDIHAQHDFINGINTDKPHPFIEDCIGKQLDLYKVLKLICLQCQCNNGFKDKLFDYYRREIIQTYGYEHAVTLYNLEETGLFKGQCQKTYASLRKQLHIIPDEVNEINPTDISYTFSGYSPISVRLAQIFSQNTGWRSSHIIEVLNNLPGPIVSETQQVATEIKRKNSATSIQSGVPDSPKVTLVMYIGGVTYSELAAYRFLSQQEDTTMEYIVATTSMISSKTFLNSLSEKLVTTHPNPFDFV